MNYEGANLKSQKVQKLSNLNTSFDVSLPQAFSGIPKTSSGMSKPPKSSSTTRKSGNLTPKHASTAMIYSSKIRPKLKLNSSSAETADILKHLDKMHGLGRVNINTDGMDDEPNQTILASSIPVVDQECLFDDYSPRVTTIF